VLLGDWLALLPVDDGALLGIHQATLIMALRLIEASGILSVLRSHLDQVTLLSYSKVVLGDTEQGRSQDGGYLSGKSTFPKDCIVIFKVKNQNPSDIMRFLS